MGAPRRARVIADGRPDSTCPSCGREASGSLYVLIERDRIVFAHRLDGTGDFIRERQTHAVIEEDAASARHPLGVGLCTVCGYGTVGVRVPASSLRAVGLCDQCDAVYLDPEMSDGPHFAAQPHLPCPATGSSLAHWPAYWADAIEAERFGWAEAVGRFSHEDEV